MPFGTIGDFTSIFNGFVSSGTYFVQFWLANQVGGSGTEIIAEWSADGNFDDTFTLLDLVDSDPFDWTLYSFASLPSTSDGGTLGFLFRHDPDFWWLDDVDIEPESSSASPIAARQATYAPQRIAPHARLAQMTPALHHPGRVVGQTNAFGRFGFRSPAEMFRSFVQKVTHPITARPRRRVK